MQEKTQNRVYEIVRCILHTTPKNISARWQHNKNTQMVPSKNWLVKKLGGVAVAEEYEGGANTGSDDLNVSEKIPWLT